MTWNIDDDKICNSIIDELLSLIDTYEFTYENPYSTEVDKENTEKGIEFKHKQIEWLSGLKDRIMTPQEKAEREEKKARLVEVMKEINHLEGQICDIFGLNGTTVSGKATTVNIDQLKQAKPLQDKKKELQEELNKLRYETL